MILRIEIACTHPLHRSNNYQGLPQLRKDRGIPADTPVSLLPRWPMDVPGTWHWCATCTNRNAARTAAVKRLYATWQAAQRVSLKRARHLPRILGARFASQDGMSRFARRHCPPEMHWCARSNHYVPLAERCTTNRTYRGWCQVCYGLQWPQRKACRLLYFRRHKAAIVAEHDRCKQELAALRQEVRQLRNLKTLLDAELVARPFGARVIEPEELASLQADALAELARTEAPTPVRHRDRRKSFGV